MKALVAVFFWLAAMPLFSEIHFSLDAEIFFLSDPISGRSATFDLNNKTYIAHQKQMENNGALYIELLYPNVIFRNLGRKLYSEIKNRDDSEKFAVLKQLVRMGFDQ